MSAHVVDTTCSLTQIFVDAILAAKWVHVTERAKDAVDAADGVQLTGVGSTRAIPPA